jgi:hypothetical protein
LLVGKGTNGIEITQLRISFEIEKTAKKNPNKNRVQIWNLQKSSRALVEKPDTKCLLYAGYGQDAGPILIFSGGVTIAWSRYEPPDVITEFEISDGAQEIRDSTISVGYNKNIKASQILNDAAKSMGLPLTVPSNFIDRIWQNGMSFFGPSRTLLDKVTKGSGLEWSIQNGNIQVIPNGMVTTRQGIEIGSNSGMVGSPERERKAYEGNTKRKKTNDPLKEFDGWRVKTLLMPTINPGDRVKLNTRDVQGVFRCDQITHRGDNFDGDWMSEMKLVDPSKPISQSTNKGGIASRGSSVEGADDEFAVEDVEP